MTNEKFYDILLSNSGQNGVIKLNIYDYAKNGIGALEKILSGEDLEEKPTFKDKLTLLVSRIVTVVKHAIVYLSLLAVLSSMICAVLAGIFTHSPVQVAFWLLCSLLAVIINERLVM